VYSEPWIGPDVARVARIAIRGLGTPPVVDIPDSLMHRVPIRSGSAGEVDYAVAMAALPRVVAAVGPLSSRATLLVARIYADRHVPLIAPTSTNHRIGDLGPWVFQLAPDDRAEGDYIARYAVDHLGARRVTIFYLVADEYGLGLRDGIVQGLKRRRVAPVDEVGIIEGTDFAKRVRQSLRRATPDALVIATRGPEALGIIRAFHERLPSVPVIVGDGVPLDSTFIHGVGTAAPTVRAVAWWHPDSPDSLSRIFVHRYERANGVVPDATDAMEYDAIMVAAQAVHDVGSNRRAIRRYLSRLGKDRPPYRGVTGLIAFGAGRPVNLLMTGIRDGRTEILDTRGQRP
jgi:branched-chain amino acid transport system substrate-binding protein